MKKHFETPEMTVIHYEAADIMTASAAPPAATIEAPKAVKTTFFEIN